jgi:hypothetical protein
MRVITALVRREEHFVAILSPTFRERRGFQNRPAGTEGSNPSPSSLIERIGVGVKREPQSDAAQSIASPGEATTSHAREALAPQPHARHMASNGRLSAQTTARARCR